MTAGASSETIRSTPLHTAFTLVFAGLELPGFAILCGLPIFALASDIRREVHPDILLSVIIFAVSVWFCSFVAAYLLSAAVFSVRLDGNGLTYRTGFDRRTVGAAAITGICFLDSLNGWRYVVIRSPGRVDTLTNMAWSRSGFDGLREQIKVWSRSGGLNIPITSDDTYSHRTTREIFFGSANLPRYYRSKMPFTAAAYALVFAAVFAAAMILPVSSLHKPARPTPAPVYPSQAQRANVGGLVRMQCRVTASGTLENCRVLSESPPGYGFGQAALKMAHLFQMRSKTRDGKSVAGATVIVPVRFRMPPKNGSAAPARPAS